MHLDRDACDRARRARDARFDGRFYIGVTTTRIYCRPVCPARAPKDAHVRYFATAAAAEAEGFRPCLRCRPETAPGSPAWTGTSALVRRALRLIEDGGLDAGRVEGLAAHLGVTGRHLRRLFQVHVGATPHQVAATRRVQLAKQLLDGTTLPVTDIAFAAGFRSVRRFNARIRQVYGRPPTAIRRRAPAAAEAGAYRLTLAVRAPYDWAQVIAFFRARATPGVETVTADGAYHRTVACGDGGGTITVRPAADGRALLLLARLPQPCGLLGVVERVSRMFDVHADPAMLAAHLGHDPLLGPALARRPGIRLPGAWDGFEVTVRAILGQQVSVAAATTMAGRLASAFGEPMHAGDSLTRLFPTPARLADADLEAVGVIRARAAAIREVARRTRDGTLCFDADTPSIVRALTAVAGIGAWTAQYVAMRGLADPDAFPSGDLILCRRASCTPAALERRAEAWRPWRGYAVMLLWQDAGARSPKEDPDARSHAPRRPRVPAGSAAAR